MGHYLTLVSHDDSLFLNTLCHEMSVLLKCMQRSFRPIQRTTKYFWPVTLNSLVDEHAGNRMEGVLLYLSPVASQLLPEHRTTREKK